MGLFPIPILQEEPREQNCKGQADRCVGCALFKNKTCSGCNANGGTKRCRMSRCMTNCGACGGYKVRVPSICIKSPMLPMISAKIETIAWDKIPNGRVLDLKNKAITVMNGGKRPIFRESIDPRRYDVVDAVGVSLWRVWSTRGWFSSDLKDYLGIPNRVKLILTTHIFDDALERATNSEVSYDMQQRKDVDAYMPLVYSGYTNDAIWNTYLAWRRTLSGMEETGGDFLPGEHQLFSNREDFDIMVKKVPQVFFYTGTSLDKSAFFMDQRRRVAFLHKTLPKKVSFWFWGMVSPGAIHWAKRATVGRQAYFLASSPWMASHKGSEFTAHGRTVRSALPQDELTIRAIENYAALVSEA